MRSVNQYGTEVSVHRCTVCGRRFTVCPPRPDGHDLCRHVDCESYDAALDVDMVWDSLPVRRVALR